MIMHDPGFRIPVPPRPIKNHHVTSRNAQKDYEDCLCDEIIQLFKSRGVTYKRALTVLKNVKSSIKKELLQRILI